MNTLRYVAVMATAALIVGCQKEDPRPGIDVSDPVEQSLFRIFPNAENVKWEKRNSYYAAEFTRSSTEMTAWFSPEGEWYMTEESVSFRELPQKVRYSFTESPYRDYSVVSQTAVTRYRLTDQYCITVSDSAELIDLYFTPEGVLYKEILLSESLYPDRRLEIAHPVPDAVYSYIRSKHNGANIMQATLYYPGTPVLTIIDQTVVKTLMFGITGYWASTSWEVDHKYVQSNDPQVNKSYEQSEYRMQDPSRIDIVHSTAEYCYRYSFGRGENATQIDINTDGTIKPVV